MAENNLVAFEPGIHTSEDVDTSKHPGNTVYYFKAGSHNIPTMTLQSGNTVYLEGGAVVSGIPKQNAEVWESDGWNDQFTTGQVMHSQEALFLCHGGENLTFAGSGMLCGRATLEQGYRHMLIDLHFCKNVHASGIILRESSSWTFWTEQCENVRVDNIKILGCYVNNDGLEISGCKDYIVQNSFVHNADDSLVIKAWAEVNGITVKDNTVWNDANHALGIVHEICATVDNVVFINNTVIHSTDGLWDPECESGGVLAVWIQGGGNVRGTVFKDIIVEDNCHKDKEDIKLTVTEKQQGKISDILFENITFLSTAKNQVRINGFDHTAKNITFRNVTLNGERLSSAEDSRFLNQGGQGPFVFE
jgi:polygalacturonase